MDHVHALTHSLGNTHLAASGHRHPACYSHANALKREYRARDRLSSTCLADGRAAKSRKIYWLLVS